MNPRESLDTLDEILTHGLFTKSDWDGISKAMKRLREAVYEAEHKAEHEAEQKKRLEGTIYDIGKVTLHHRVCNKTLVGCLVDLSFMAKKALETDRPRQK